MIAFLKGAREPSLFISALTLGELRKGIELKRRIDPSVAMRIETWANGIESEFADRILPVDVSVARLWGTLSADRSRPVIDTLIAATALVHGLTLVTRNSHDLRGIDLTIIDPWNARQSKKAK